MKKTRSLLFATLVAAGIACNGGLALGQGAPAIREGYPSSKPPTSSGPPACPPCGTVTRNGVTTQCPCPHGGGRSVNPPKGTSNSGGLKRKQSDTSAPKTLNAAERRNILRTNPNAVNATPLPATYNIRNYQKCRGNTYCPNPNHFCAEDSRCHDSSKLPPEVWMQLLKARKH